MRKLIARADFAPPLGADDVLIRSDGVDLDLANSSGRIIPYVFSDTSIGRDGHVIAANAWQLGNFNRNPVFLWAHDSDSPPIGRVVDIGTVDGQLRGAVEYIDRDVYPFADTIFQMVKAGFLNATSTGWLPLDWKRSADASRPGGIDFSKVDLLEISQVPVPALPTALVAARASGIDTGPMVEWAERMLDGAALAVLPRAELELLRREAKMPSGKRGSNPATGQHEAVVAETAALADPLAAAETTAVRTALLSKRSLYHVGWLAYLLNDLGALQECTEWEAAHEGDGSAVPGQLLDALKQLGATLIAMTEEEVAELLTRPDDDAADDIGEVIEMAAGIDLKRSAFKVFRKLDDVALAALSHAGRRHLAGQRISFRDAGKDVPLQRAGKVLSAGNEKSLRDAHDHMTRACDMVRGVIDKASDDEDPEDDPETDEGDDEEERALRQRKAAARQRRLRLSQPSA